MISNQYWRRDFLRTLVLLGSFLPAKMLLALPLVNQKQKTSLNALPAFLDTLIPEDSSPSASQLDVNGDLVKKASQEADFERLLVLGCAWLDKQSQKLGQRGFENLDEASRITIVQIAEQSAERSLPRVFFTAVRHFAFGIYYAHPEAWLSLGYSGPPQPAGFLDFADPPGIPHV